MRYPEEFIGPMRQELTQLGVQETRTPEDVDAMLGPHRGTVLMVINSMCGCAAGRARPGIALALRHATLPDTVATVFAGLPALLAIGGPVQSGHARVHVTAARD